MTRVVWGSTCGKGSDKGQLSHRDTDGTSNVYSNFYMWMHCHSECNPTLWEGRVCKPTHCRAFEVSQLCCLSCWRCFLPWPIGFLWHQDPLGPEGQHSGVLFNKWDFSHSIAHLSCAAHFLGKTLSLVLVRWPCTNALDEKDSLGE